MATRSIIGVLFLILAAVPLQAQSTWINPASANWSVAASWDPVGVPASGTALTFTSLFAGAYTATNDLAGVFQLSGLTLNSQSGGLVTIANGAGASLEFLAGSTLTMSGAGPVTLSGTTINLLGLTNIAGAGSGVLTINSQITGTGPLNINRTTTNYLGVTNLTSTTANSFSGAVVLTRGILSVSSAGNLGTGTIGIETTGVGLAANGELRTSVGGITINNPILINNGATLNVSTGSTYVIGSAISGIGTAGFNVGNYILSNAITLEGANTFAGATTLQFGSVTLRGTAGQLDSATISVFRNSSLVLDSNAATTGTGNTGGNQSSQNRILDTTVLNLNRSNFNFFGNATTATTETLGTVNNSGWGIYTVVPQTAAGATLTITDLNRANSGTFEFRGGNLGLNAPGTANSANVMLGNIDGTPAASHIGGTPGTPTAGIFRFMTGSAAGSEGFLTYGPNGLRLLNTATEYSPTVPTTFYRALAALNNNVRTTTAQVVFDGLGSRTNAGSLVIAGNGAGVFGFGGLTGALFNNSGAILNTTSTGMIGVGEISFGNSEARGDAFVTVGGTLLFDSVVTNVEALHVAGANRVSLNNVNNSINSIVLNSGTLQFNEQVQLGGAGIIHFNGGFLDAGNLATGVPDTLSTDLEFGPAGGIIRLKPLGNNTNSTGQSMILTGTVTGTGPLQVNSTGARSISGGGTLILAGDATSYSGLVMIDGGTVQIDTDARLGTNPFLSLGSTSTTVPATLAVTATTTTAKNIMLNGFGIIDVAAGTTLTANGYITGTAATAQFTKRGAGEMVLTREATHGGPTNIGNTSLNLSGVGGTLRLTGQGALLNSSSFTINPGSTLILDNSTTKLENRLNAAPVNMAGGTLRMIGDPNTRTVEVTGQLTFSAGTGSIIDVAPSSLSTDTHLYFSGTTNGGLTMGTGATGTLRAPGLGGPGAGTAQINIVDQNASPTGPTLTNGMVPHLFGEDTFTGVVPGMVKFTAVAATATFPQYYRAQLLFASDYTDNAFPDSTVTVQNARLSAAAAPTGSSAVNSLFVNTGGSLTIGAANTSTVTSGTIIMAGGTSISGGTLARTGSGAISIYVGTGTATLASELNTGGTANTLAKAGPGTLELTGSLGATNAPATIAIQRGTFRLGSGAAIPAGTVVNAAAGATFDVNGTGGIIDVGAVNGLGTVTLGTTAGTVLRIGTGNATSFFGGTISGTGSLEKIGTGTLRFSATTSYAGPITLTAGTLAFGNGSTDSQRWPVAAGGAITAADGTTISVQAVEDFARPINANVGAAVGTVTLNMFGGVGGNTRFSGDIVVGANKTLAFGASTSGFSRISGVISGAGNLNYNSVINTIVDGNNAYTGTTAIATTAPAFVGVGSDTAFGIGGVLTINAASLVAVGGSRTIANPVTLAGTVTFGTTLSIFQGDDLTFAGNATLTAARTFATTGSGRLTFTNVSGAFSVTKTGGGSLAFQGAAVNYTGTTTISAGTFLANGTFSSGGAAVTVAGGAVLGGTGTINRAVSISALGTIAPGESAGSLTVNGNLGLAATSVYYWELTSNTTVGGGINWDKIAMSSGDLTVTAGATLVPAFQDFASSPDLSPFWSTNRRWNNIIDLTGTATNTTAGVTFTIDNSSWIALGSFSTTIAESGSGIDLVWTVVPEPSLALLGLAVVGVVARMRRNSAA